MLRQASGITVPLNLCRVVESANVFMMKLEISLIAVLLALGAIGCSDDSTEENTDASGGSMAHASGGGGGEAPTVTGGTSGSGSACSSEDDSSVNCRAERLAACAPLDEPDCEAARFCAVLTAQKVISADDCRAEEPEVVGCGLIGCGATYTLAEDDDQVDWVSPSDCLPLGWTEVSLSVPDVCGE